MSTFKRYSFVLTWAASLALILLILVWTSSSASVSLGNTAVVLTEHVVPALDGRSVSTETAEVLLPYAAQNGFGLSAAWSAGFWQWLEQREMAPLAEEGPIDCSLGQSGDVWFIAGTSGGPPVARSGTVPAGKTLFIPLLNLNWANEPEEDLTIDEKRAVLAAVFSDSEPGPFNSKICNLTATINGEERAYVRLLSPPFAYAADSEAVADGYYFGLRPEPGVYEIEYGGALCDFEGGDVILPVNVNLTLTVEDEMTDK